MDLYLKIILRTTDQNSSLAAFPDLKNLCTNILSLISDEIWFKVLWILKFQFGVIFEFKEVGIGPSDENLDNLHFHEFEFSA